MSELSPFAKIYQLGIREDIYAGTPDDPDHTASVHVIRKSDDFPEMAVAILTASNIDFEIGRGLQRLYKKGQQREAYALAKYVIHSAENNILPEECKLSILDLFSDYFSSPA